MTLFIRHYGILAVALTALGAAPCIAGIDLGYALMVQQSPPDGGQVTPNTGIHKYGLNQMVTLTAEPKPGYRFLYWLGDVIESNCNYTSVWLDSPKIVVAVFEREEFELPEEDGLVGGVSGAGDEAVEQSGPPRKSSFTVSSGNYEYSWVVPPSNNDSGEQSVPEPATMALLGLGSVWLLKFQRRS